MPKKDFDKKTKKGIFSKKDPLNLETLKSALKSVLENGALYELLVQHNDKQRLNEKLTHPDMTNLFEKLDDWEKKKSKDGHSTFKSKITACKFSFSAHKKDDTLDSQEKKDHAEGIKAYKGKLYTLVSERRDEIVKSSDKAVKELALQFAPNLFKDKAEASSDKKATFP